MSIVLLLSFCHFILPTLQNSVEPATSYGSVTCAKPDLENGIVTPDSATIGLFESYTLTCGDDYYLTDSSEALAGISPIVTCVLDADRETGILSPAAPFCKESIPTYQNDLHLEIVNQENPYLSQYAVDSAKTGCVQQDRDEFKVGECPGTSKMYLDLGCKEDTETLIGYYTLRTMDESVYWGKDILIDTNLKLKLGCVITEDTKDDLCSNVNEVSHSDSKMFVRIYSVSWEKDKASRDSSRVMNLVAGDDSVKYRIACDPGYNFQHAVDEWGVYGHCTGTVGMSDPSKNTFHAAQSSAPSTGLSCHAICAANPEMAMFDTANQLQFKSLFSPEMRMDEKYVALTANVVCESGTALSVEQGTVTEFEITCTGGDHTVAAYGGKLNCNPCPVCKATCPAIATSDNLDIPSDNAVSEVTMATEQQPHGQTITVSKDDITCTADHTLLEDSAASYQFTCGDDGVYSCVGGTCPVCKGTCAWLEATEEYDYRYADPSVVTDKTQSVLPGSYNVEVYCLDSDAVLVGPRFLSCLHNNTLELESAGFEDEEFSCLKNVSACEAPDVTNAILSATGNMAIGESYTVTCPTGSIFDTETQEMYQSTDTAIVECVALIENGTQDSVNDELPSFTCYEGCAAVTDFSGSVQPGQQRRNSAPYPEGTVLTFTCQSGYHLVTPDGAEQTCSEGRISSVPQCKANGEETTEESNSGVGHIFLNILLVTVAIAVLS